MKWRIVSAIIYLICALMDIPMGVIHKNLWEITCGVLFLTLGLNQFNQWRNERGARHPSDGLPPAAPPRPELSITADPVVYRDPVSGERFAVVTISNTVCLWDSSAQDALTTAYSEILWLGNGQGERTSTTANALNQQEACGHDREDR